MGDKEKRESREKFSQSFFFYCTGCEVFFRLAHTTRIFFFAKLLPGWSNVQKHNYGHVSGHTLLLGKLLPAVIAATLVLGLGCGLVGGVRNVA